MNMNELTGLVTRAELIEVLAGQPSGKKEQVGFRLSDESRHLLDEMAQNMNLDRTKTLELLIRCCWKIANSADAKLAKTTAKGEPNNKRRKTAVS